MVAKARKVPLWEYSVPWELWLEPLDQWLPQPVSSLYILYEDAHLNILAYQWFFKTIAQLYFLFKDASSSDFKPARYYSITQFTTTSINLLYVCFSVLELWRGDLFRVWCVRYVHSTGVADAYQSTNCYKESVAVDSFPIHGMQAQVADMVL